jgi:hypothetical protein
MALVAACAAATLPTWGATAAQFDAAFAQFNRANGGDNDAIDATVEAFEVLLKSEPTNPLLLAYAGAATTMRARATFLPWKKMSHSEDGLALVDKSLALLAPQHDAVMQHGTPGALEVKLTAASTYLAMPGFMNRGAQGAKLLGDVLASPLLATAPLQFRGATWMTAGRVALKDGRGDEARKHFQKVIDSGAPQADAARTALAGVKS